MDGDDRSLVVDIEGSAQYDDAPNSNIHRRQRSFVRCVVIYLSSSSSSLSLSLSSSSSSSSLSPLSSSSLSPSSSLSSSSSLSPSSSLPSPSSLSSSSLSSSLPSSLSLNCRRLCRGLHWHRHRRCRRRCLSLSFVVNGVVVVSFITRPSAISRRASLLPDLRLLFRSASIFAQIALFQRPWSTPPAFFSLTRISWASVRPCRPEFGLVTVRVCVCAFFALVLLSAGRCANGIR